MGTGALSLGERGKNDRSVMLTTYAHVVPRFINESIPLHPLYAFTKVQKREQRYSCTLSLISALDRSGWSAPRSGHFIP
jgi:hypothetical protein